MNHGNRIEAALTSAIERVTTGRCPPKLASALDYAVFPGGARVRPRLCLAVAAACGDDLPELADAAASAIELLHCASLVHDDLPCFDDADTRRGKPSVHCAYGEPLAVLAGDALIVSAFEALGLGVVINCRRSSGLISIVARAVGGPSGIVAGQAWECEESIPMAEYHQAKTGSLFSAATMAGALAAGADPGQWRILGERLGESYQIADDICDLVAAPGERGKPGGRDRDLGRPNAAGALGVQGALARLKALLEEAVASIPECSGKAALSQHILTSAQPYLPKQISRVAA
jgi:geranylgeranyl diphosphate synthase type II